MSDGRLTDYLGHLKQAALDATGFVEGMTREAFRQDKRTQQAVVMSLVIMGEAATRLMERHAAYCEAHPSIPWRNSWRSYTSSAFDASRRGRAPTMGASGASAADGVFTPGSPPPASPRSAPASAAA